MLNQSTIPNPAGDQKAPSPTPELVNLYDIPLPPEDDPSELLKHRFLCRGGAMLLLGPTGIGKSALSIQCAILWSLGREAFGIKPSRPLRILIIQAENDPGDMAEFREGILCGLGITPEERTTSLIQTAWEDSRTGEAFCVEVLKPLLEEAKPDLMIIDPALAYLGGDANQQKDVSAFLRNNLNPLLHRAGCGLVLVHHTNKPPQGEQKGGWQANEFAYLGSGSADWANWARAVLAVRALGSYDYFELRAAKRGKRLHWREEDLATPAYSKIIAHSPLGICWREASKVEYETASRSNNSTGAQFKRYLPSMDEFTGIFPASFKDHPRGGLLSADQIKKTFHEHGWHKDFYRGLCDDAEAQGRIVSVPGEGRGGQVLRGLPAMVKAFEQHRSNRGSILEEVPLAVPKNARRKVRRSNSS